MRHSMIVASIVLASTFFPSFAAQDPKPTVQLELRIFDGEEEVTAETRVRVFPTGQKDKSTVVQPASGRLTLTVPADIYDAQAIRERQGQVANIRWAEKMVVMRYPDEAGKHLEVINFKQRYGALQLVGSGPADFDAAAFSAAGEREPPPDRKPVGRVYKGDGYLVVIAPAGRYDVRVRQPGATPPERWLLDLEVPANGTRLKRF